MLSEEHKRMLLEKAAYKCKKCGYASPIGSGLEVNPEFEEVLCIICNKFSPDSKNEFESYINEKVDWQVLEPFRRYTSSRSSSDNNKLAMIKKAREGKVMSRPAFGFDLKNGNLIPNRDALNVKLIFDEFANGKSMNQISKQYGLSVNGIKKVLKNFTYIGKVKFNNQISQGSHNPLISAELFNRVQQKFENKE